MATVEEKLQQQGAKSAIVTAAEVKIARTKEMEAIRRELLALAQEDKEIRKQADEIKQKAQAHREKHFQLSQRMLHLINR